MRFHYVDKKNEKNVLALPPKEQAPFIHVLVVEDHPLNLRVEKELLETIANCEVTEATTLAKGLEKLVTQRFDLILLDINLTDGNGTELAKKAKKDPRNDTTPIIAVTAHSTESELGILYKAGIDDLIEKPITKTKLEEALRYYVYDKKKQEGG